MNLKLSYALTLFAIVVLCAAPAAAQFTITIPKIPKIKKTQPTPDPAPASTPRPEPATSSPSTPSAVTRPATPSSASANCSDGFTQVHTENMEKTRKEAEEYRPGLRNYYVQDFNDNQNEYLWAAISPSRRKEWLAGKNIAPADYPCFVPLLDAIAAAAKKTLPTYHPNAYTMRDPVGEKLLRANIPDLADATVFKVAFKPGPWIIGKDQYNFPINRFKYGVVWAKWASNDHGYCQIYYINLVQDYAGGGTYGGSYANYVGREPGGCPAGK